MNNNGVRSLSGRLGQLERAADQLEVPARRPLTVTQRKLLDRYLRMIVRGLQPSKKVCQEIRSWHLDDTALTPAVAELVELELARKPTQNGAKLSNAKRLAVAPQASKKKIVKVRLL